MGRPTFISFFSIRTSISGKKGNRRRRESVLFTKQRKWSTRLDYSHNVYVSQKKKIEESGDKTTRTTWVSPLVPCYTNILCVSVYASMWFRFQSGCHGKLFNPLFFYPKPTTEHEQAPLHWISGAPPPLVWSAPSARSPLSLISTVRLPSFPFLRVPAHTPHQWN